VAGREKLSVLGNVASLRMVEIVPEKKKSNDESLLLGERRQEESPSLPPAACRE